MDGQRFELRPVINSPVNDKVRYVKTLQRRRVRHKEQRFIAEGIRVLEDAIGAGHIPALVFLEPEWESSSRMADLVEHILKVTPEVYPVGKHIMKSVSDTVTPQGILAVFPFVNLVPAKRDLLLIMDGIQDPGNFGTLLRSAEAAGVDQMILAPGTVDVFNPKVVRAGTGAHFRLPIVDMKWPEIRDVLKGRIVYLAESGDFRAYYDVDWSQPVALIVSNEGLGASQEALSLAAERVTIPMKGGTESLNVGVAGSVILFEALRQRISFGKKR